MTLKKLLSVSEEKKLRAIVDELTDSYHCDFHPTESHPILELDRLLTEMELFRQTGSCLYYIGEERERQIRSAADEIIQKYRADFTNACQWESNALIDLDAIVCDGEYFREWLDDCDTERDYEDTARDAWENR
jgi:hypothetical protein